MCCVVVVFPWFYLGEEGVVCVRVVLWCLWVALLVGTPYYLGSELKGPVLSPSYMWVAAGLGVGSFARLVSAPWVKGGNGTLAREGATRKAFGHLGLVVLLVGIVSTLIAVLPEWLLVDAYSCVEIREVELFPDLRASWEPWQPWLLLVGACSCAWVVGRECVELDGAACGDEVSARGLRVWVLTGVLSMVACGFGARALWLWVYVYPGHGNFLRFSGPSSMWENLLVVACALAAWTVFFLACQMLAKRFFGMRASYVAGIRSVWVESLVLGFAFGMACFGVLARIVPMYSEAFSGIIALAAVFSVGAALLVGVWGLVWAAWRARHVADVSAGDALREDCAPHATWSARGSEAGLGKSEGGCEAGRSVNLSDTESGPAAGVGLSPLARERLLGCGLAPREFEVAVLTCEGLTSSQVADACGIKPSSVRATLQRVYRKAGVEDGVGLKEYAGVSCAEETSSGVGGKVDASETKCADASAFENEVVDGWRSAGADGRGKRAFALGYAAALLAVSVIALATATPGAWGENRVTEYVVALVSCALGLLWFVRETFCAFSASASSSACGEAESETSNMEARCSSCANDVLFWIFAMTASFGAGGVWEELLRAPSGFSFFGVAAPFFLAGVGCVALLAYLVVRKDLESCLIAQGQAVLCYRLAPAALMFFAVGIVSFEVGVNSCEDLLVGNAAFLYPLGGRVGFSGVSTLFFLAVFLLCAFSLVLAVLRLADAALFDKLSMRKGECAFEERVRHYLQSRGLNETQAEVLLHIAQGKNSTAIARELMVSRGTVNSARAAGYKILNVHTRTQLALLIRRQMEL